MPFTVNDLIGERSAPETSSLDETVQHALTKMIEHDYSQIPVVDKDGFPLGMLTSDSIVRALNNFEVVQSELRVRDAMVPLGRTFGAHEDLFSLLPALQDAYAVLVVDRDEKLTGIVTNYDTAEYFRQRAENMMFVQDVEETIKSYINLAFTGPSGEIDDDARRGAIEEITPSNRDLRGPFVRALREWLKRYAEPTVTAPNGSAEAIFDEILYRQQEVKAFEKLTLGEYIELFLHKGRWERYQRAFPLKRDAIRTLLKAVLDTRNDLAHFRVDITPQQREALRFCKEWLQRYEVDVNRVFGLDRPVDGSSPTVTLATTATLSASGTAEPAPETLQGTPPEEDVQPDDSGYGRLAMHLQSLPSEVGRIELTFSEIEAIIQEPLPLLARSSRSFWANDPAGRPHIQQLLDMGWRVGTANMTVGIVYFVRIRERQRAYIDFYNALLTKLREAKPFPIWDVSPDGNNWIQIASIRNANSPLAAYGFAFTADRQFRVELYIDTGDFDKNKRLFDALYERKEHVENSLGASLSWERIDHARASRIAQYHASFITDSEKELANLRTWAVDAMIKFHTVMEEQVAFVLKAGVLEKEIAPPLAVEGTE